MGGEIPRHRDEDMPTRGAYSSRSRPSPERCLLQFRGRRLDRYVNRLEERGNLLAAAAAKEMGGAFTDARIHSELPYHNYQMLRMRRDVNPGAQERV